MSAPEAARALSGVRGQALCLPLLILPTPRGVRYTPPPCAEPSSLPENGAAAPSRGASRSRSRAVRARAGSRVQVRRMRTGNIVFSNLPPEKGQRRISCLSSEEPRRGSAPSASGSSKSTPTPRGLSQGRRGHAARPRRHAPQGPRRRARRRGEAARRSARSAMPTARPCRCPRSSPTPPSTRSASRACGSRCSCTSATSRRSRRSSATRAEPRAGARRCARGMRSHRRRDVPAPRASPRVVRRGTC